MQSDETKPNYKKNKQNKEKQVSSSPNKASATQPERCVGSMLPRQIPLHPLSSTHGNPFQARYINEPMPYYPWTPLMFSEEEYTPATTHSNHLKSAYDDMMLAAHKKKPFCYFPQDGSNIGNNIIPLDMPMRASDVFVPTRSKTTEQKISTEIPPNYPDVITSATVASYSSTSSSCTFPHANTMSTSASSVYHPSVALEHALEMHCPNVGLSDLSSSTTKKRKADDAMLSSYVTLHGGIPLSTEQDENWLSPSHHFFRLHCVEYFCATRDDIDGKKHNKDVHVGQAGIRCIFCSKLPYKERAVRSFSFPSTTTRIYQSVTGMLHCHFDACKCIPDEVRATFKSLKSKARQGANAAKKFWIQSAKDLGLTDTESGMFFQKDPACQQKKARIEAFRHDKDNIHKIDNAEDVLSHGDRHLVSEYLFEVMKQMTIIHLTPEEQIGPRRMLPVGCAGLGCRHCAHRGGLGRIFPSSPKKLKDKVEAIHDHLIRCSLCPSSVKNDLQNLHALSEKEEMKEGLDYIINRDTFFNNVWSRMKMLDSGK